MDIVNQGTLTQPQYVWSTPILEGQYLTTLGESAPGEYTVIFRKVKTDDYNS